MPKSNIKPEAANAEATIADTTDEVIPCSLDEVDNHLRAFIAAFILPQAQPRWLEFLIDRRAEWDITPRSPRSSKIVQKADKVLRMFAADGRYCVRVPNARRTAAYFEATFGTAPGVYFGLATSPCKLTAMQADTKFSWENESALLSFRAGKKALFFCHDGSVWKCEKE